MLSDSNMTAIPPKSNRLRVLHTSDWHLGKRLYHQTRYEEFEQFLAWLITIIHTHQIDILIVAGDVFDTMTPSNKAQQLYYQFLNQVANSNCQHVVIISGNHDSPSFLEAPKALLTALNITVVGTPSSTPTEDVLVLKNTQDQAQAIIIAVPYLRDKDIRTSEIIESITDKDDKTTQAIAKHYRTLTDIAIKLHHHKLPIIATGHLFVAGSHIYAKDDGMRPVSVGTLGKIGATIFDERIDYVALGHIHACQTVNHQNHIRYCGSPIAMGFGEAQKNKCVLIIDFEQNRPTIHSLTVPIFQHLCRIEGNWQSIKHRLTELVAQHTSIWVEVIYTGDTLEPNLVKNIQSLVEHSTLNVLSIQNKSPSQRSLSPTHPQETLSELTPIQVFDRLLIEKEVDESEKQMLKHAYQTLINDLEQEDTNAL